MPYRYARIVEILRERGDWDLERTLAAQQDLFVLPWREFKDAVLAVRSDRPRSQAALEILAAWDGQARAESAGAAVYEYFVISLAHALAAAKAPKAAGAALGAGFSPLFPDSFFFARHVGLISQLLREQPPGWFDEPWGKVVEKALERAHLKLEEDLGEDPSRWRWGDAHNLVLYHRLGIRFPLDRLLNRGPYPTGGDHQTVAQAGRKVGYFGSNVTGLANLRMAVEVGDWDRNYFILAGGQSGNPLSPHYDNQLKLWLEGKAIEIAWTDAAIEKRVTETLVLTPVTAS
jgi:penicillin amidase